MLAADAFSDKSVKSNCSAGTGEANVIALNVQSGTWRSGHALRNPFSRNAIYGNPGGGIILDPDTNENIDAPQLLSVGATVTGAAAPGSAVEFFADDDGQGEIYITSISADGTGEFSVSMDLTPYGGMNLTATCTDAVMNTSEFSEPMEIPGGEGEGEGESEGEGEGEVTEHTADQDGDGFIELTELLRVIQFYNSGGYHPCPGDGTEDGFCPGAI